MSEIAKNVLGSKSHMEIQQIPLLSNDVIRSHIQDVCQDILLQVVQDMKTTPLKVRVQIGRVK